MPHIDGVPGFIRSDLTELLSGQRDHVIAYYWAKYEFSREEFFNECTSFEQLYGDVLRGVGYSVELGLSGRWGLLHIYFTEAVLDHSGNMAVEVSHLQSAEIIQAIHASPAEWRKTFQRYYLENWKTIMYDIRPVLASWTYSRRIRIHQIMCKYRYDYAWPPGMFYPESIELKERRKRFIEFHRIIWHTRDPMVDTFSVIFWRRLLGPIFDLCEHIGYRINRERGCDCQHHYGESYLYSCQVHHGPSIEYSDKLLEQDKMFWEIINVLDRYGQSLPRNFDYESRSDYYQFMDMITDPLKEGQSDSVRNTITVSGDALSDYISAILDRMPCANMAGYDRPDHLNLIWNILRSRILWQGRMKLDAYPQLRKSFHERFSAAMKCTYATMILIPDLDNHSHEIPLKLQTQIWCNEARKCLVECNSMGIPYCIVPLDCELKFIRTDLDSCKGIEFMPGVSGRLNLE